MPSPAWALVAFVAWYAALVVGWRVLLRRWGLAGPGAPAREALDREEHVARRSLRALLAFDALVLLPVGIPMLVAAAFAATLDVDALEILGGTLLGLVVFLLPVLPMLRRVRLLEAHRLAGLPPPPPPSPPTSGSPTLDAHLRGPAPVRLLAVAVICAVSVLAFLVPDETLALRLAKDNLAIRHGEVWRLLTVALVHGSVLHLFFNAYVLADVGRLLERLAGGGAFLAVLVLGTAAGSAASLAAIENVSVGASGGIFAVLGAVVAFGFRHRALFTPTARSLLFRAAGRLLILNLALTFAVPRIDWAAHLGGLALGALLGLALRPTEATRLALGTSRFHPPDDLAPGPGGPPPHA